MVKGIQWVVMFKLHTLFLAEALSSFQPDEWGLGGGGWEREVGERGVRNQYMEGRKKEVLRKRGTWGGHKNQGAGKVIKQVTNMGHICHFFKHFM